MDWPSWFKTDSVVKNLNISGWFKDWLKFEKNINIEVANNFYQLPEQLIPQKKQIEAEEVINNSILEAKVETRSIIFSDDQELLIDRINKIHLLKGRGDYDFRKDFGAALNHIRNKPSPNDWYNSAALFICNAIPDGGTRNIFDCLKKTDDPEKNTALKEYKTRIQGSFTELQKLRHADKKSNFNEEHLTPYEIKIGKKDIPDERISELFQQFEADLIDIFKKYEVKNESD
jgi:hypothetical protein